MKFIKNHAEQLFAIAVVMAIFGFAFWMQPVGDDTAYGLEEERAKRGFVAVLPAKVVSVYDGDTIKVQFTTEFNVRLLDCWAAEVKTKDPAEKRRGIEAKKHLETLLKPGDEIVLELPYDGKIGDSVSLGRFLARVFKDVDDNGEDDNISELMVKSGYATKSKKE